ncbi:MAG: ABC transporter permease [Candidatus Doudnabacteria bacterium]|nr:ABC transporter permease [Candidatus Doudnabacteria bacterium]
MNPQDYLKLAATSLLTNKIRSSLTMLGVIIGVFSVITFLAIGEGLRAEISGQFEQLGSNLLIVLPGKVEGLESFTGTIGASTLSLKDLETIKTQSPLTESASPVMLVSGVITVAGETVTGPFVVGTDEAQDDIQKMELAAGSFFSAAQVANQARVMVLGHNAETRMFGETNNVVGRRVSILGQEFEIIGLVKKSESAFTFGDSFDNLVYIPITTAQTLTNSAQVARIMVKVRDPEKVDEAREELTKLVRLNHGGSDDFTVLKQEEVLEIFNDVFGQLTLAVSGIGAISLFVAGIGIMNIMFVSVTERTREIGLRKAVGATNNNILMQFLAEASLLSLLGGGLGVLLAFILTVILKSSVGLPATVTWQAVLLAAGISIAVGVIFGIVPAIRAARKNPIDALRYE